MNSKLTKIWLAILGLGCGYFIWLKATGFAIPCIFRKITGWMCPGCGITTMIMSLVELDFTRAYNANPFLFVTGPVLIAVIIYDSWLRRKNKPLPKWLSAAIIMYCIALCTFGVIRNM